MNTLPYRDKIGYKSMNSFGGITNANLAGDGDIIDMTNMSSDKYPYLTPIAPRKIYEHLVFDASAMCFFDDKPVYACGGALIYNNAVYSILSNGRKQLAVFPDMVCVFPDKKIIKRETKYLCMDARGQIRTFAATEDADAIDVIAVSVTAPESARDGDRYIKLSSASENDDSVFGTSEGIYIYTSGTWVYEKEASELDTYRMISYKADDLEARFEWNCPQKELIDKRRLNFESFVEDGVSLTKITASGSSQVQGFKEFEVGDFIHITGLDTTHTDSMDYIHKFRNGTTVKEIGANYITVVNVAGVTVLGYYTPAVGESVIFERRVPDFECVCVVENRLWGAVGSTIYASELGRPERFSYNTISTSAWAVDTVGENFTACICYDEAPVFFKENAIYKIYGDTPSEFGFRTLECAGVKSGARDTLAQCQGALFYESALGVMRYTGGYPTLISNALGGPVNGIVGGADGIKYYLSCEGTPTYVYDTRYGIWHKETGAYECFTTHYSDTYAVKDAEVYILRGTASGNDSNAIITSTVTFADIYEGTLFRKQYNKLRLRVEAESGELWVFVGYDGGLYDKVLTIEAGSAKNIYIKDLIPQRCDSIKIKLLGTGMYTVYAIDREYSAGSDLG